MKSSFATFAIAFLVLSVGYASATPPCPDGMTEITFDDDLWVVGDGCHHSGRVVDSAVISVEFAGPYDVYVYAIRAACQPQEDYYVSVNGVDGPVSLDDAVACTDSERLDYVGEFPFNSGNNTLYLNTASECPPDETPNSVHTHRICLDYDPPGAPEFPITGLSVLVMAFIPGIAYIARKK
ncbi:MAG: hypothetical protein JSV63_03510 [Candidatus Aenigmatarchaeota archaeon]|nr:MAG: hypothetical protein JSV63_03510 [Candidatus Aenigmarchaeota archaeon]